MSREKTKKNKNKKALKITLFASLAIVVAIFIAFFVYLKTGVYEADDNAIEAMNFGGDFEVIKGDDYISFEPENAKVGFIFYPGGKVEHDAYISLMEACASKGILCILVEMPFDLAIFDINAADGVREKYSQIEKWYIGGHSLGGSMACSYVSKNEGFDGVILLGSYSTENIKSLNVLSIYGSEDKVLNKEKYDENKSNLPDDFIEYIIDGGNHAYFGVYGSQKGDGTPTITNREQIEKTANKIADFVR